MVALAEKTHGSDSAPVATGSYGDHHPINPRSHRGLSRPGYDFAEGRTYVDELIMQQNGTAGSYQKLYNHANHLFSPAAVTDAAGVVVERYRYSAYGKQTITANDGITQRNRSALSVRQNFTGRYNDEETSQYFFRSRQYGASLGRFASRDFREESQRAPIVTFLIDGLTPSEFRAFGIHLALPDGLEQAISARLVMPASPMKIYQDGFSLYSAYFIPLSLDPTGHEDSPAPAPACPTVTYCVYIVYSFPGDGRLGGQAPEGHEIKICVACPDKSNAQTPCALPGASNRLRLKLDDGRELGLPAGPGSTGCGECPKDAAKGGVSGKTVIPYIPLPPKTP